MFTPSPATELNPCAAPQLSVCVATHNRPQALLTCLNSLSLLTNLTFEILVVDDASSPPAAEVLADLHPQLRDRLQMIRYDQNRGYITARNQMAQKARAPYILSLDDDAYLWDAESIYRALAVLAADPQLGAIALAEANPQGHLWPGLQPAPVNYPCYVPTFLGYGHILRREVFLALGGYRETFQHLGEEGEYCKRLLDRGWAIVYLPTAQVVHHFSPQGRSSLKALRNQPRNRCYDAIYNAPFLLMLIVVLTTVLGYVSINRSARQRQEFCDPVGDWWLLQEMLRQWRHIWADRQPLRWQTYWRWRHLRRTWPAYSFPSATEI